MPKVNIKCKRCKHAYSHDISIGDIELSRCPQCHDTNTVNYLDYLEPLTHEILSFIADAEQSQRISESCLYEIKRNIETIRHHEDNVQRGLLRRAELIVRIGELLLRNRITEQEYYNLSGVLPDNCEFGWRLDGTELVHSENPSGQKSYMTRIQPDGSKVDGGSLRLHNISPVESVSEGTGCLIPLLLGLPFLPLAVIFILFHV